MTTKFKSMKAAKEYFPERKYKILTDDEADEAANEYILDTVWAFKHSFLSDCTGLPVDSFTPFADKCESANDAILAMIKGTCGLDMFIQDALSIDGRGAFIAQYDGVETEITIGKKTYFVYRMD